MDKQLKIIGHTVFLILFILSIIFCTQRILTYDTSYQLTKIINNKFFNIEAARFSTVITQILPLIGIWLDASLKTILYLYSISFYFVYYLVFLFVTYILKKPAISILIPIVLLFGVMDNFFYIVTETHQALVYSVLFYAWLNKNINFSKVVDFISGLFIIMLAFFSHFVGFFAIIFILGVQIIQNNEWKKVTYYFYFNFVLFLFMARTFLTIKFPQINLYETNLINSAINNLGNIMKNFTDVYSYRFFESRMFNLFLIYFIMFLVITIEFIFRRKILLLIFIFSFYVVFFVLTIIIYYQGDADYQMEKDFLPYSLFTGIPFLIEIEQASKKIKNIKKLILITGFVFHFFLVLRISNFYSLKILYLENLTRYARNVNYQKFVVDKNNVPKISYVFWPLSTETLLFSSLDSPDSSVTVFFCDFHDPENYTKDSMLFYNASFWEPWPYSYMNKRYFNLQNIPYRVLKIKDIDKDVIEKIEHGEQQKFRVESLF